MKKDINDRRDIKKLVITFYERLLRKDDFATIFVDTMQVDVLNHIDHMILFWENVLFNSQPYQEDLYHKHLNIHFEFPLESRHFRAWLDLFNETVDEFYEGVNSEQIKKKALSIATVIKMKLDRLENLRIELNN